jgi:hypothetical protein
MFPQVSEVCGFLRNIAAGPSGEVAGADQRTEGFCGFCGFCGGTPWRSLGHRERLSLGQRPMTGAGRLGVRDTRTGRGQSRRIARMTWEQRDLPVLRSIVELTDEGGRYIQPQQIAERTGLDTIAVQRALNALAAEDPSFFEFVDSTALGSASREIGYVKDPTGHARRAVGTWPTADALADRIIAGLNQAADAEEDEDRRGRLRRTAAWFGGAGRDILVNVAGTAISHGEGI